MVAIPPYPGSPTGAPVAPPAGVSAPVLPVAMPVLPELPSFPAAPIAPAVLAGGLSVPALALALNTKEAAKRVSKAGQTSTALRKLHWPEITEDDLWLLADRKRGGFAQVPRTLPLFINFINDITKRKSGKAVPAGKTYMVLWMRVYDEGLVRIDSEDEAAYEAGYGGERNVSTFRAHMNILKELGFIDYRRGIKGPMHYVLMHNPYTVVKRLHAEGLVSIEQFSALTERANAIGSGRELGA